ncbi:hypothetical protein MWU78_20900 [Arenibacter sp. F26102]|uniref:hypothetical protein n=1 Tax=Arenibacter sp. F26102 TaxID=2926416 RepID=UPI001FF24108|nr:hypothetical protein [Arenibacter sp. F26102]MCK0148118.1 hypothetical protein [Arenibacter sp. F26102]
MCILLCFLVFLFRERIFKGYQWYGKTYFILSIIFIGLGEYWCCPVGLAWHDVPYNYTYRFKVKIDDGANIILPKSFFSLYDFQFTLGDFKYLSSEPLFRIVMGAADESTSHFFNTERPVKEIFEYEMFHGKHFTDILKREKLNDFLQQYIFNFNNTPHRASILSYFKAPSLLYTYPRKISIKDKQKITEVSIIEVTTLYSKSRGFEIVREREVFKSAILMNKNN